AAEPMLSPVILGGKPVGELPDLEKARRRTTEQLQHLHPTSRRLLNPHIYKVSISEKTLQIRRRLRERMTNSPTVDSSASGSTSRQPPS
ncbi:MAG: hypothetical protein KAY24_17070, partial [Candidatus Eisenbacteria sp.]|nr:hypothetical protein [Candidatus Eisenbacteria bacterium]